MEPDWKKKYEEALERMKYVIVVPANEAALQALKETVFPELAENKDNKIIEELIEYLTVTRQIDFVSRPDRQRWITWLNKCKESLHVSETCKENAYSFTKEDEKIMKRLIDYFKAVGKSWTHRDITGEQILCWLEKQKNLDKMIVVSPEVWDNAISEAYENGKKDGEKQKEQKPWKVGANAYFTPEQKPAEWSDTDNIGWDEAFACVTRAEKAAKNEEELQNAVTAEKWLKEIKFKYYVHPDKQEWSEADERLLSKLELYVDMECFDRECNGEDLRNWLKSLRPQPKQEWNEEDIYITNVLEYIVGKHRPNEIFKIGNKQGVSAYKICSWLKSLKNKGNFPKSNTNSPSWSEEDDEIFNNIIEKAKGGHWIEVNEITWLISRFKSLRPQPHWKPSKEQMEALESAVKLYKDTHFEIFHERIVSLYEQLKKLI